MRTSAIASAVLIAAGLVGASHAAGQGRLEPGAYEVEVRLELPHIDDVNTRKLETVCLAAAPANGSHGLVVLSGNNPLAKCPTANAREQDGALTFDIVCPGVNQARGWARYRLASNRFQGRIEMKMGGKNMTMTEVQSGHRIGACGKTAAAPHS